MADRKEYIERGALIKKLNDKSINAQTVFINTVLKGLLYQAPVADVVEVVRCRDCKKRYVPTYCALWYGQIDDEYGCRDVFLRAHNDDFYCAYGERKDGADNATD